MSNEGLLISAIMLVIVSLWAFSPFVRRPRVSIEQAEHDKQWERLRVQYDRVLTNIRDLDEDFATGKIGEEDYEADRAQLVNLGIKVLRALDEQDTLTAAALTEADTDEAIEAAVTAYRERSGTS